MTNQEKVQQSTAEALWLLRNKPVNSTLIERWRLLEEAWETVKDLPQPLQFGNGLTYILERASLPTKPHDLLLGRFSEKVPTEEEETWFWSIWKDRHAACNPITAGATGHITLDWAGILSLGIPGYIAKAEKRLEEEKAAGADENTWHFLEGMVLVYRAIRRYIQRYDEAAEEAGLCESAEVCRNLVSAAPRTFREAMQLMLFVVTVYYIYAGSIVSCLTYGRMDDLLLPYYEADLKAGRLTREEAGYLIDDFNCKANLPLGRGEHQMANPAMGGNTTGWERNPVFDSPTYVLIGGYSNTADHQTNPLTSLFAQHINPAFKNPVYIYRWTKDRPDEVWDTICDKLRQNASILVYNDETVIPAMKHIGVDGADAVNYSIHACNWPDITGGYAVVDTVGGPIPRMILETLLQDGKPRAAYDSIDAVYEAVEEHFRQSIRANFAAYRARYRSGPLPSSGQLSCTDCFTAGTIEAARGLFDGGVKYPAIYVLLRNIGTAADMMAAVDSLVYRQKVCTLSRLAEALTQNFEGCEDILAHCRRAPKFGRDDDLADRHAVRLLNRLLDVVDEEAVNGQGERDVLTLNVTITDMWHIQEGANLPATPDGRLAGAPLSENLSPTVGVIESVTALLNSVSKLPFERIHSGAFNLRLRKDVVAGEAGLARLQVLADTYLENGGMQLQLSIADTAVLRQAQEHPENYGDLLVRITGYSAIFVDMSKNAQDEIIRRDELCV